VPRSRSDLSLPPGTSILGAPINDPVTDPAERIITVPPKTVDVVGLGQCCLDYISSIAQYPEVDQKCEATGLTIQGGGPVATALVALARWNLRCAIMGITGDDSFGQAIRASLQKEQIDIQGLQIRPGGTSQVAFIVVERGSGRRNIFWQRPRGPALAAGEIDIDLIQRARVLHTDGLFTDAALEASQAARRCAVPVVVDAGTLRPACRPWRKTAITSLHPNLLAGN